MSVFLSGERIRVFKKFEQYDGMLSQALAANRDAEASPRKPLAVGLLIDSLKAPAWVARVVREVQAGDYAEIAAVIVNRTHDAPLGERAGFNGLLFGVFRLLDRLMSGAFNNPFKRIDIATDVQSAETIAAAPRISGATVRFDDADLARIRRLKLDVLLCFGFPTLRGGILDAAEYGAWSYRHGQDGARGGSHGLFWDMYDRNTVSSVVLRIDGPSPRGGRVIYRSVGSVRAWSYSRNVRNHYWKSARFVPRRLQLLFEQGFPAIEKPAESGACPAQNRGRVPTNREMLRFLPRHAALLAREAFRDKKWFLAVNADPRPAHLAPVDGEEIKIHRAPPGRFWADPFPVVVDGQIWVFFEDYRSSSKKAVISCAPVSSDGVLGDVSTALERSYHLSYPFILEHEGELYMMPETWAEGRVELWRSRKFPDDWVLERVLLDGLKMSDPTMHRQDGKLWLFGAVSEAREWVNDELHVYMADALDGAWRPHPANPVVSDCRHARPAGRLFSRGGELIRPGQDCSGNYGRGITLNRVEKLTPDCYAETTVGRIDGAWLPGSSGSHTLNYAGGLEFLDGVGTTRKRM